MATWVEIIDAGLHVCIAIIQVGRAAGSLALATPAIGGLGHP